MSEDGLLAAQSAIRTCREQLPQNVTPQVAFDGMVGRLRLACGAR